MNISKHFTWNNYDCERKNHFLLPNSIRGLIVGSSGCGKSTLINNLLLQSNVLDYNRLYVFGNSLHQIEYRIMKAAFKKKLSKEQIQVIFSKQKLVDRHGGPIKVIEEYDNVCKGTIEATFYDSCEQVPDPGSLDEKKKNLLLFDDCMLDNQSVINQYFTRGRHANCNVFYIAQNYFKLPRQTIRENANMIFLFRQNMKNMRHFYDDHISSDNISFETFINEFCNIAWDSDKYNFITIDQTRSKFTGKYRMNLDFFWLPPVIECMKKK